MIGCGRVFALLLWSLDGTSWRTGPQGLLPNGGGGDNDPLLCLAPGCSLSLVFGWAYPSCGGSDPYHMFQSFVSVSTFLSLMRELCLSSALLWESCGASAPCPTRVLHQLSPILSIFSFSHSLTSKVWKSKAGSRDKAPLFSLKLWHTLTGMCSQAAGPSGRGAGKGWM